MNTDNMTISGETIDYGPCAFMDAFDPATVFSSIDHGGRYAYGNQPHIAQWNLARLAEALLPLIDAEHGHGRRGGHGRAAVVPRPLSTGTGAPGCGPSSGSPMADDVTGALIDDLLALLHAQASTSPRASGRCRRPLRGDAAPARSLFAEPSAFDAWADRWRAQLRARGPDAQAIAAAMDRVNPVYIPRNHHVEEALAAATARRPRTVPTTARRARPAVRRTTRPGALRRPAPPSSGPYRTFCGT